MRILHTADWHLGRTLEGRSRLDEQAAFLQELVEIADDQRIDAVLLAGDVYDSVNPPAAAEQLFYDAVSRLSAGGKRPILVIAGNHDSPERLAAPSPLAAGFGILMKGWPDDRPFAVPSPRTGETMIVAALPYPSESRFNELLSAELDEALLQRAYSERIAAWSQAMAKHYRRDTINVLMSHLFVAGGKETDSERPIQVGGAYTVDPSALCKGAQYVALGHLHRPQTFQAAAPVRYSGSPLQYSFSEAGQAKSVSVVELSPGGEASVEELYLRSGRPLVEWHASEGIEQVHRWLDEGLDAGAWIDLKLNVTDALSMEQIAKLRKACPGLVHIRPIYPEMEARFESGVSWTERAIEDHFRRFYARQSGGAQPEEALVRLFLELIGEPAAEAEDGEAIGR